MVVFLSLVLQQCEVGERCEPLIGGGGTASLASHYTLTTE